MSCSRVADSEPVFAVRVLLLPVLGGERGFAAAPAVRFPQLTEHMFRGLLSHFQGLTLNDKAWGAWLIHICCFPGGQSNSSSFKK